MTGLHIIFGGMLLFVTIVVAYDLLTRRQHVASANSSADPPEHLGDQFTGASRFSSSVQFSSRIMFDAAPAAVSAWPLG